jgi:hypothetical protein
MKYTLEKPAVCPFCQFKHNLEWAWKPSLDTNKDFHCSRCKKAFLFRLEKTKTEGILLLIGPWKPEAPPVLKKPASVKPGVKGTDDQDLEMKRFS